jgi:hypothetical protein
MFSGESLSDRKINHKTLKNKNPDEFLVFISFDFRYKPYGLGKQSLNRLH